MHIFKIGKITKEEKNSLKSVSQVFKILFQTGDFKTFVLRGVFFSKYVQLKSSFSYETKISSEICDTLQ